MTATPVVLESRPDRVPDGTAAAAVVATDLPAVRRIIDGAASADVDRALGRSRRSLEDFAVLLSSAAAGRIEDLAAAAHEVTRARFGATVRLFAPLYLSRTNACRRARTAASRPATKSPVAP